MKTDLGGFAIVPDWILEADMPAIGLRLWCVLARFANREDVAYPSNATLCERLGISEKTLRRAMAELVSIGAVVVEHSHVESGRQTTNRYFLRYCRPMGGEGVKNATRKGEGVKNGTLVESAGVIELNESQLQTREAVAVSSSEMSDNPGLFGDALPAVMPWWETESDPVFAAVGRSVMDVPKFARALPDGPDRDAVVALVTEWRRSSPGDEAILYELGGWVVYNKKNEKKGGRKDPISALRRWFGSIVARWARAEHRRGSVPRGRSSSAGGGDSLADRVRRRTDRMGDFV